jgi:hypothetical protein
MYAAAWNVHLLSSKKDYPGEGDGKMRIRDMQLALDFLERCLKA